MSSSIYTFIFFSAWWFIIIIKGIFQRIMSQIVKDPSHVRHGKHLTVILCSFISLIRRKHTLQLSVPFYYSASLDDCYKYTVISWASSVQQDHQHLALDVRFDSPQNIPSPLQFSSLPCPIFFNEILLRLDTIGWEFLSMSLTTVWWK